MQKLRHEIGIRRTRLLGAAGLLVFAAPILVGLMSAPASSAQAQAQGAAAAAPVYEYEVASIKLNKSGNLLPGFVALDDGINVSNVPLQGFIFAAFGVGRDQITGAPDWLTSERYDINAKMESSVADAVKKLSSDDRKLVTQQMLLALFVDRCKLKFHRETKTLSTYTLVLAKNGPKFKESKPGEPAPGGIKVPDGHGGNGSMQIGDKGLITFHGLPITFFVQFLSVQLGHAVVDKTGLTGLYDFSWQFTPDPSQLRAAGIAPPAGGSSSGSDVMPADPQGTDLFAAVQEQLGLKLESGKGPVELVVIDHIERPSDN